MLHSRSIKLNNSITWSVYIQPEAENQLNINKAISFRHIRIFIFLKDTVIFQSKSSKQAEFLTTFPLSELHLNAVDFCKDIPVVHSETQHIFFIVMGPDKKLEDHLASILSSFYNYEHDKREHLKFKKKSEGPAPSLSLLLHVAGCNWERGRGGKMIFQAETRLD